MLLDRCGHLKLFLVTGADPVPRLWWVVGVDVRKAKELAHPKCVYVRFPSWLVAPVPAVVPELVGRSGVLDQSPR